MKKLLSTAAALLIAAIAAYFNIDLDSLDRPASGGASRPAEARGDDARSPVAAAFAARESDRILVDDGTVIKVLSDDNDGSRHQRFIVQIQRGLTVLVAHNIDLAPRVAGLREGDRVRFKGEYEYTDKGGVVHWTHHDPKGWRDGGWIEHRGERYE